MAQWGGLVNIHAHILGTDKKNPIIQKSQGCFPEQ